MVVYKLTSPSNKHYNGIHHSGMYKVANGKRKQNHGYIVEEII